MKVSLMNKNTEILVAEYNPNSKFFDQILEYKNIDYAPLITFDMFNKNENILNRLSEWFRGRGIPENRDLLYILLSKLNISTPLELLDKAFALSLSDQYWVKPYGSNIKYENINFFENDFDSIEFMEATFSNEGLSPSKLSLKTPNNTTDGMLRKSWIIKNKKRYLIKGGYINEQLQPFNEVLASMICERLGFNHVTYTIDVIKNNIVSSCECFIDTDTEYIPAFQIMNGHDRKNSKEDYKKYIKILRNKGITKAKKETDNMFILDYLMLNEDRHLNNFGIIRNVNTLEWIKIAPIFDTGESFQIESNDDEMIINGQGKFFYRIDRFEDIIKNVSNLKRLDLSKLDGIVEEYDKLLHKYQEYSHFSDKRINNLCILLNSRINKLREIIISNN